VRKAYTNGTQAKAKNELFQILGENEKC